MTSGSGIQEGGRRDGSRNRRLDSPPHSVTSLVTLSDPRAARSGPHGRGPAGDEGRLTQPAQVVNKELSLCKVQDVEQAGVVQESLLDPQGSPEAEERMGHIPEPLTPNNYSAEMWSGSEEGSYLRLIDLCITQL